MVSPGRSFSPSALTSLGFLFLIQLRVEGFWLLKQNCALRPSGVGECICERAPE